MDPSLPQTGFMGPQTQQALQTFQSQQQLPATGFLDPNTVSALQAACSGPAGQPPPPPGGPPVGEVGVSEQGEFPWDFRFRRDERFREHREHRRWERDRERRWPFLLEAESGEEGEFPFDFRFHRGEHFRERREHRRWERDRERRWPFLLEAESGDSGEQEFGRGRRYWEPRRGWDRHAFFRLPEYRRISWAQSCLAQRLGSWVVQDGVYGPNTAAALRAFQERHGLAVNGVLDEATAHALHERCGG